MTQQQLINEVLKTREMPYRHQARVRSNHTDCIGLVCHVADLKNIEYTDITNYKRVPRSDLLIKILGKYLIECSVDTSNIYPLDVLCFVLKTEHKSDRIKHCGLYITDGVFLHAYLDAGKVVQSRLKNWHKKLRKVYKWPR